MNSFPNAFALAKHDAMVRKAEAHIEEVRGKLLNRMAQTNSPFKKVLIRAGLKRLEEERCNLLVHNWELHKCARKRRFRVLNSGTRGVSIAPVDVESL
jgi:hypothetical protein